MSAYMAASVHVDPDSVRRVRGENYEAVELGEHDCRVTLFLTPGVRVALIQALEERVGE